MQANRIKNRTVARWVVAAVSIGAVLGTMGEISSRFLISDEILYQIRERQIHCMHPDGDTVILCPDQKETLEHPAGFDFTITTNSNGERITPLVESKHLAWVIGDSLSMGYGISDSESFPYRLSELTGRRVRNVAIDSLGSLSILKITKEKLDSARERPEIMFWVFSRSDFQDDPQTLRLRSSFLLRTAYRTLYLVTKYSYLVNWLRSLAKVQPRFENANEYRNMELPPANSPTFGAIQSILEWSQSEGIPLVVLVQQDWDPISETVSLDHKLNEKIIHLIRSKGGIAIDMVKVYRAHPDSRLYIHKNGHPSAEAAEIFAEIAQREWIKIGSRQTAEKL